MAESLGTAALNLTVDTRGIEVGIDRAKSKVAGFSNAAQQEYQKLTAAQKKTIDSLSKQADQLGLTRAEQLAYNATLKSSGALHQELLAKINANNAAVKKGGIEFNQYGLSAKQTTAALRQVPAQLTDIFVGLQGGQNPLTVLIQQGGQLKDVFGGVVPAAKALGNAVLGLVNPWTLAAGAIAIFVLAINDAQKTQGQLADSLILTGNAANLTVGQLQQMAKVLDDTTAASERQASAVVAQVAATGRFTAAQIEQVSKAALQMEQATGQSVEKTIANFAAIGDDPVQAIQRLNNAVGDLTGVTNFLTAEQIKQVEELDRQGQSAEAAKIIFDAYADAINSRAPEVTANISNIGRAWKETKEVVGDIVDFVSNALNKMIDLEARAIKAVENKLKNLGTVGKAVAAQIDAISLDPSKAPSKPAVGKPVAGVDNASLKAYREFQSEIKNNLTEREKQEQELTRIQNEGAVAVKAGLITQIQLNKALADSKARFAEAEAKRNKSGAGAARAFDNASVKENLSEFKNALAVEQASIQQGTQILQANFAARNISAADYFAKQRDFIKQGQQAEEASLTGQIAILEARNQKGKDAVDTVRQIGEMEAQLAKVRSEGSTKLALLTIQEQEFYERRANAIQDYRDRLMESNAALQLQTNAAIARIGMGSQEAAQQERINEAYVKQALAVAELNKQLARHEIDQTQFDADIAAQQEATNKEVAIVTDGFQRMLAAQGDWHAGFQKGLADWLTGTADVATQISQITNDALNSASEALANFALTGKLEIKKLLADILTELVKFFAKRAVMQFIESFASSFGNSNSMVFGSGEDVGIGAGYAKGGAFDSSGAVTKFAAGGDFTNTIVTRPTMFRFANGSKMGEMGEAGPEAIVPLHRGPDGKLGVRLSGGGPASNVSISVNTIVNSDGSSDTTVTANQKKELYNDFTDRMRRVAQQTVMDEMRPGGSLHSAGVHAR